MSGNQARTFRQYWAGQQRQTEERWARDAEKRRQDAWQREMFENNSLFLSKSQLVAQLDKEWLGAHTPEQQRTVLQRGIDRGVVPSFISNMLNRADASNAESFQEANALYQEIRGLSPKIALNAAGDMAAKYEQYHADVTVGGLPPDAILSRFSLPKQERDIASFSVGQIFKDEVEDKYTEVTMGDLTFQRTPRERFLARQEAERIVAESPGISAEIAIKMAFERLDNQHSVINGQRVPNRGLRMNAEEGVTALVQGIERSLGVGSETYTARPLEGGNNQYVIVDASGFPVTDPDTGTRIVFDPNQIGGHYEQWRHAQGIARLKLEKAAALERNLAAARTPAYAHAQTGLPLYDHEAIERMSQELDALKAELDTSDARDVQSRIQELKLEEAQLLAGYTAYLVGAGSPRFNQSRLKAVRAELKSLSNTGGVPDDFMTYLQRQ